MSCVSLILIKETACDRFMLWLQMATPVPSPTGEFT